jgi:hypothetical protein
MASKKELRQEIRRLRAQVDLLCRERAQNYEVVIQQKMLDGLRAGMSASIPRMEPSSWWFKIPQSWGDDTSAPRTAMTTIRAQKILDGTDG